MSHSRESLRWYSQQPLRIRFRPTKDGSSVSITDPVLYLSDSPDTPLEERTQITTENGMNIDGQYIEVLLEESLREGNYWYRLDLNHNDGAQTYAAGSINKVDV